MVCWSSMRSCKYAAHEQYCAMNLCMAGCHPSVGCIYQVFVTTRYRGNKNESDVGVCVCLSPTIDNKTVLSLLSMAPPCTIVVNLRNVTEVYNLWPHPLSYLDSRRSKRDNNHTDYQHCAMAAQTSVLLALVCFVFFILVKGKSVSVLTLTLGFD